MDIAFLGTGSGYPTPNRGASCLALRYEGEVWMIDCGEGSQTQVMKLKTLRPGQITKIFITHLHGDHMFGLPGLMCTISMALAPNNDDHSSAIPHEGKPLKTIEIFGPVGLRRFLREALNLARSMLQYKYVVHELVPQERQFFNLKDGDPTWSQWNPEHLAKGSVHPCETGYGRAIYYDEQMQCWPICQDNNITVVAGWLQHRIPSFGYVFTEGSKPGRLDSQKLIEAGVPKGPLFGRIKNGEIVTLPDGRILNPQEFIGPPQNGRKVAVLQDTRNSWAMKEMCHKCDVLIHEVTNENSHRVKCIENGHSTSQMTAEFASSVEAAMLVITHVSQRYKHPLTHEVNKDDLTTDILVNEAKLNFQGPILAAYDGLVINVKRRPN